MAKKIDPAAALAELLGIAPPTSNIAPTESKEEISRQAEAAIAYASPEGVNFFIRKDCKNCGLPFAHTAGAVAFCSDTCRAADLLKIGIQWDWTRPPSERWGRHDPLVVPAPAVKLIDELTDTRDDLKCPVYNHMRDTKEHGSWCWSDTEPPEGIILVPYPGEDKSGYRTRQTEPDPKPEQHPLDDAFKDALDILKELGLE